MLSDHAIVHIGQYALIRNNRGQILVLDEITLNRAGLPGGRLEEGEHWLESLQREVKEETNIDCSNPKPLAVQIVNDGETLKYCVYFTVDAKPPYRVKVDNKKYHSKWISKKTAHRTNFYNDQIKKIVIDFLLRY